MSEAPDHRRNDLYIQEMVYNRLPFLARTDNNNTLISTYTYEVMLELEVCFQVDADLAEGEQSNVGNEAVYSMPQKVIIADVVAVEIIIMKIAGNMGGTATGDEDGTNQSKYLKKAKAGSVETEWDQFDVKKGGALTSSSDALLKMYQQSASRKSSLLGCTICWGTDGMEVSCGCGDKEVAKFIVVAHNGCGTVVDPEERG